MSIMSIVLPYDYICSNSKITWKDIRYGIERKYLQPKAAIEHAMKLISESDEYDEKTLELALLSFEESNLKKDVDLAESYLN